MATGTYFYGLGRRKSATASARLYEGKGNVTINGIGYNLEYTDPESSTKYTTPFVFDPDYTLPV